MTLKIIAHIEVIPEKLEEVIAIQKEAVEVTLKEPGCVEYALFQEIEAPYKLTFVETWATEEAFKAHLNTPYFIEKGERLKGMLVGKDIRLLKRA